jgi:hypothetical protein
MGKGWVNPFAAKAKLQTFSSSETTTWIFKVQGGPKRRKGILADGGRVSETSS